MQNSGVMFMNGEEGEGKEGFEGNTVRSPSGTCVKG